MRYSAGMKATLPEALPASGVIWLVAVLPFASFWLPFQTGLWVRGVTVATIVAALIAAGHRDIVRAVREAPRAVRLGLLLYSAATIYGAAVGMALGNPIRYVVTQTASMLILPASFVGFCTGTRLNLKGLATGLGLGGAVALAVHLGFLVAHRGEPSVAGEALRLALPNDVSLTGVAVMATLMSLAWWYEVRNVVAACAATASACLLVGSMSRGAWLVSAGAIVLAWWLSSRRAWWTLALVAAAPLLCVAALVAASSLVSGRGLSLVGPGLEVRPHGPGEQATDLKRNVVVTGRPVEIDFAASGSTSPRPVLFVEARNTAGVVTSFNFRAPTSCADCAGARFVQFLPPGTVRLDFWVWQAGGNGEVLTLGARELPGALAGWLRTVDLRLRTTATALTHPAEDGTMQYRLSELAAVRRVWAAAPAVRRISGQGLGAVIEFPNSSWDNHGHRIVVPVASYLHNFYVFLGFKLGIAGLAALAGLLLVAGWSLSSAWVVRSHGGSALASAAAACWCAYLAWAVTSPEIINANTATFLGALVAASVADAATLKCTAPERHPEASA